MKKKGQYLLLRDEGLSVIYLRVWMTSGCSLTTFLGQGHRKEVPCVNTQILFAAELIL